MAEGASAQRRAPPGKPGRWFEKPGASPADKIPAFREALVDVAKAWNDRFANLASSEGEIAFGDIAVCKVDDILPRRGTAAVLAVLHAPGWNTQVGVNFDRVFVTTMVEALFGGGGEDVGTTATVPFSPVDLQIAEVVVRHVADALSTGFARRIPSAFKPAGLQAAKHDPSFLGKPNATVVIGTLTLTTLGGAVQLDILVPLAAMMVFAEELASPDDGAHTYDDPRWTQRLETEVSRASMVLTATVDLEPMTLGSIAALHEGQLIELPRGAGQRIRLLCGTDDLFRCELGQSDGRYTLRIEETVGSVTAAAVAAEPTPDAVPDLPWS